MVYSTPLLFLLFIFDGMCEQSVPFALREDLGRGEKSYCAPAQGPGQKEQQLINRQMESSCWAKPKKERGIICNSRVTVDGPKEETIGAKANEMIGSVSLFPQGPFALINPAARGVSAKIDARGLN